MHMSENAGALSAGAPAPVIITPLRKLGFLALLLFLFLLHSRVLDMVLSFLHIPMGTLYLATAAAFLSGGFFRAFTHRIGAALLLFTGWVCLAVPFSIWRGGSVETARNWVKALLVFVVVAGLIYSYEQLRQTIHLLAFSILTLALIAVLFGDMSTGRLILERGRFTNPNDLAQMLLMGLPFWWFIAMNPRGKRWRKTAAWLAMIPIFVAMARTGSRGALVGAIAVFFVLFLRSSVTNKVQILLAAVVLVVAAAVLLPDVIKKRYFTFFTANQDDNTTLEEDEMEDSAITSTEARWSLFKSSVALTMLHPLFGVGPGQFAVAQDAWFRDSGKGKGQWQVTHNTFTEVSSENGLPALLFYVAAVAFTFAAARVQWRGEGRAPPEVGEMASAAYCLRLSLLAYVVSAMFGSFAYQTQFLVLAGLGVAFARTAKIELNILAARVAPVSALGAAERKPAFAVAGPRRRDKPAARVHA